MCRPEPRHVTAVRRAEPFGQEHRQVLPADFVRRVAEDPLGTLVEEDDALLLVHGDDGIRRDGQEAGEQLGGQGLLHGGTLHRLVRVSHGGMCG